MIGQLNIHHISFIKDFSTFAKYVNLNYLLLIEVTGECVSVILSDFFFSSIVLYLL